MEEMIKNKKFMMQDEYPEEKIEFLGFLCFQNKLKDDTAEVIQRLAEANIISKIISGDNALTTLKAARESSICS